MDEIANTYLTVNVGDNTYGIHVSHVIEILEYTFPRTKSTDLPFMLGLIEHRSTIIPMIDAGVKFGQSPIHVNDQSCIVVISIKSGDEDFNVALLVDNVSDVVTFTDEDKKFIETHYKPGYVSFATKYDGRFILALDVDKVFNDADIVSMNQILSENKEKED